MYNEEEQRNAYSEVHDFIELLEEYDRNKIPKKLQEFFEREKNPDYMKRINPNVPVTLEAVLKNEDNLYTASLSAV